MNGIQENLMFASVQTVTVPIGTKPRKVKATHRCNYCKQDKPREAFRVYGYHHGLRLDSRCIECYPEYRKTIQSKWPRKKRDPEKQKVRDVVKAAIRRGEIVRQPCEICGGTELAITFGNEDSILRDATEKIAALTAELDAWKSVFGTTQLTHAQARLAQAEKTVQKNTEEIERLRGALETIKRYGCNSDGTFTGICDYGCDTPQIAQDALMGKE
jgi:hypothetical protein